MPKQRLAYWQSALFRDTYDVIVQDVDPNTDGIGTPGDFTYSVLTRGLRGHHNRTENMDISTNIGRVQIANMDTREQLITTLDADVPNGSLLRRTTKGSKFYGKIYRVLGQDDSIPSEGGRDVNQSTYDIRLEEQLPTDLPA